MDCSTMSKHVSLEVSLSSNNFSSFFSIVSSLSCCIKLTSIPSSSHSLFLLTSFIFTCRYFSISLNRLCLSCIEYRSASFGYYFIHLHFHFGFESILILDSSSQTLKISINLFIEITFRYYQPVKFLLV